MNFAELRRELRAFTEKAIKDRMPLAEFRRSAQRISDKYLAPKEFKDAILSDIINEYNYADVNALLREEQKPITEILTSLSPDFANQKVGLRNDIISVIKLGLDKGEFSKAIQGRVEDIIGKYKNYANTITRTALSGFDTLSQYKDEPDDTLYEYGGPAPQRQFCKHMIGQQLTKKQIDVLSSQRGYNVFIYKGLYNCRHFWIKVG